MSTPHSPTPPPMQPAPPKPPMSTGKVVALILATVFGVLIIGLGGCAALIGSVPASSGTSTTTNESVLDR